MVLTTQDKLLFVLHKEIYQLHLREEKLINENRNMIFFNEFCSIRVNRIHRYVAFYTPEPDIYMEQTQTILRA